MLGARGALLGLVCLLVGWLLMFLLPEARAFSWAILGLGTLLIASAAIVDFRRLSTAVASRRGRLGIGATVNVALFAGIIVLVNAISVGFHHRFDLTGLAQFTLTSQTKTVLTGLDKPVEAVAFFGAGTPAEVSAYAKNLLAEYQSHTRQLSVRDVDTDLHPDQARQYGVEQLGAAYGTVVFRGPQGQRQVLGPQVAAEAEHAFTSAILEVTGARQKKVYFLAGHGEWGLLSEYEAARNGLRDSLFQVEELDLLTAGRVPEDAAVLVVAGPRRSPAAAEIRMIREYLWSQGRLLMLLDPDPPGELRDILASFQITIGDGAIVDPSSFVAPNPDNLLVPRTRNAFQLGETYFPGATAVIPPAATPANVKLNALVWTSPDARLARRDGTVEKKGSLAIGALVSAASGSAGDTRLVVIGDSDFASNRHYHNGNNAELLVGCVSWLAEGKEVIALDRKVLVARRLLLTPEQARLLAVASIGLLPFLLLAAGGYVWWRRR